MRFLKWLKVSHLKEVADLVAKMAALIAIIGIANWATARPGIEHDFNPPPEGKSPPPTTSSTASSGADPTPTTLTLAQARFTSRQGFIDVGHLAQLYGGTTPVMVERVATAYNHANREDLRRHHNVTTDEDPPAALCRDMADFIREVYPSYDCSLLPLRRIGDGFSYERMLLRRNFELQRAGSTEALSAARIREALDRMKQSRYERAVGRVSNNGRARAVNIELRPPSGFSFVAEQDKSFSLDPGAERPGIAFETPRGAFDTRQLNDPFFVGWDTDKNYVDLKLATLLLILLGVVFIIVVVNDIWRYEEKAAT